MDVIAVDDEPFFRLVIDILLVFSILFQDAIMCRNLSSALYFELPSAAVQKHHKTKLLAVLASCVFHFV